MDRNNKHYKMLYKCIVACTNAIWQQAAHTANHHLLTVQHEPDKTKNNNNKKPNSKQKML